MQPIIFTIKNSQVLRLGECLRTEFFECVGVKVKEATIQVSESSRISDFTAVKFGVKGQSALGFSLSYEEGEYQLSISNFATSSDWAGAIMFLQLLLAILEVEFCQLHGVNYTVDSIKNYDYVAIILDGIQKLGEQLQTQDGILLEGVKRPIHINQLYLGQIVHVSDEQLLESYDRRLGLTQQISAYFSEQHIFRIEQDNTDYIVPVNFLNSEAPTILPARPQLTTKNAQVYKGKKIAAFRLFIMTPQGEKLAEFPYEELLTSLTEGGFMLDAEYIVLEPFSKDKLVELKNQFR